MTAASPEHNDSTLVYGRFTLDGVDYLVTSSGGPHTVNVYELHTQLMICSIFDPRRAPQASWGSKWASAPEDWKAAVCGLAADAMNRWFAKIKGALTDRLPGSGLEGRPL